MKIINTSDEKCKFTWDAGHYSILPGEIQDIPDEMAYAAIRQNVFREQDGEGIGSVIGSKIELLQNVDKSKVREIATYDCPFKASGQCNAAPLKSMEDFWAHLKTHRDLIPESQKAKTSAASASR